MTKPVAAPEIFQIPLDQIDPAIAPPGTKPGTPEFEEAVIMHYVLHYVGVRSFDPSADTGASLDKEYDVAKANLLQ